MAKDLKNILINSIHDKSNIDLFDTAYEILDDKESFDVAICTAVLEHLEEPEQALRECHRVLKPGGVAIYSAPFIWHLHGEPRDFYRYTKYGLKYLPDYPADSAIVGSFGFL